jgi:hypothetical protein
MGHAITLCGNAFARTRDHEELYHRLGRSSRPFQLAARDVRMGRVALPGSAKVITPVVFWQARGRGILWYDEGHREK